MKEDQYKVILVYATSHALRAEKVLQGNGIFEFAAGRAFDRAFDSEIRLLVIDDPQTDHRLVGIREIELAHGDAEHAAPLPAGARDQEFAFDFERHFGFPASSFRQAERRVNFGVTERARPIITL